LNGGLVLSHTTIFYSNLRNTFTNTSQTFFALLFYATFILSFEFRGHLLPKLKIILLATASKNPIFTPLSQTSTMQHPFRLVTLVLLLLAAQQPLNAQTQFWADDFEDVNSPTSGSRASSTTALCGGPPATAYFNRVGTSNISTLVVYTGFSGAKFWASEDVDKGPTCVNNSVSGHQNVSWSSINISGKAGLTFKGLFAVGTATAFDGFGMVQSGGTSVFDYLIVQYRIDGGAWTDILRFFPSINNAGNGTLAIETTGDSIAQGEGAGLTAVATEFSGNIVGTGTTLELMVKLHSNSAAEETLIDNFRLFETPACSNPTITGQPANRTICNTANTTFGVTATGATNYQWQLNSGSGFSAISNGGVYSNATTSTLNITGATTAMSGYLYRCITSNATCSTTTVSATLTMSTPSVTLSSQTNVSCFGGSNGAASINAASGGIAPYSYNWTPGNPTGDGTTAVTGLAANTYTVTTTDNIGCQGSVNVIITQPTALSVTAASQSNVSCAGGSNGAATVNIPTGGNGGYSYNWTPGNPSGDGTSSVTGLTAGTWTCTVTDIVGCTATQMFTITQPSSTPGANSYSLPTSNQTVVRTASNFNYATSSCEMINAVVPSGVSPVSGSVTSKVWIESNVTTVAGTPFVTRHYEITPAVNASTATGTITLYFTQAEFDLFNTHPGSILNLPTSAADAGGISHLRIGKYSGTSGDGTGLPSSYSGAGLVIDPDDNNVVWNATAATWEITFNVSGFSGFIVQTVSSTLPVTWASFDVKKQGTEVLISWATATEENILDYMVQHSTNGNEWKTIAQEFAAGNSNSTQTYRHLHTSATNGVNYYRIRSNDLDGKQSFTDVKAIQVGTIQAGIAVLANPVQNGLLQLQILDDPKVVSLYNSHGQRILTKQLAVGTHSINVSAYTKGIYWLHVSGKTEKILIQ
jgi:hypothetical protein